MQNALALLPLVSALLLTLVLAIGWLATEVLERRSGYRGYPSAQFHQAAPVLQLPVPPAQVATRAPNDAEQLKQAA